MSAARFCLVREKKRQKSCPRKLMTHENPWCDGNHTEVVIYIIITKNICYLLWNKGLWRSLNNTYPIFLTPCIRYTNHNSTFYPFTAPNGSKCWPIVTSSIEEPVASNCDVTMTDSSRLVAMDAFLAQWWGQWSQHSGRPRTFLALITLLKLIFILFCNPRVSTRGIASWIKSQRQDSVGVSLLKSGRRLFSDSLDKAEILNTQFKSVFTKEDYSFIPKQITQLLILLL